MRVAAYSSDVKKFSIETADYERNKDDCYPFALYDNEANNAIYGRNQYLIGDLLRLADKLIKQPLTCEGKTLYFMQVAMLNQQDIYNRSMVNHATSMIPKVAALNHKKINPRLAAEVDNEVQVILQYALNGSIQLNNDVESLIADVLGVSIISSFCVDVFLSLRYKSRNYILKALRYIIFDQSLNESVHPVLNEIKQNYNFSLQNFSQTIAAELFTFYKLNDSGKHINIIRAISAICNSKSDSMYLNIPLLLNKLDLDDILLTRLDLFCSSDFKLSQIVLHVIKHLKSKEYSTLLKRIFFLQDSGSSELNVLKLIFQADNKESAILSDESKIQFLINESPNYLDIVKSIYLIHLHNGYTRRTTFFRFIDCFITSEFYTYSTDSSRILNSILEDECVLKFLSKVNCLENIFAVNESEVFSGSEYDFLCKLLSLTLSSTVDPKKVFYTLIDHDLLSKKIPNQSITYMDAIKGHSSLDSYSKIFDLHNPLIAKIENLKRFDPHQFKLEELFDFSAAGVPVKLLNSPGDFKNALKSEAFSKECDIPLLGNIQNSNIIVIGFDDECYAVINVSKFNFWGECGYGLMNVICNNSDAKHFNEAMKITQFMNRARSKTLA